MSSAELRKKLIEQINTTTDEHLLREATRLLKIQLTEIETPFQLSDEMNLAIDEAKDQIKKGDSLDHDDANQEIDEWLEK